jgi:16S rRNA G966 N2-methylase RsmD
MPNAAFYQFVRDHLEADVHRLLLSASKFPGIDVPKAVTLIKALQKVKHKIPSWYNYQLELPFAVSMEQASSEATARFKAGLFTGNTMADLSGGLGVDSYFFSKSFKSVQYIEQQELLCIAAKHNFSLLGAANIEVHSTTAESFTESSKTHFDLIYLDPARRDALQNRVFLLSDCSPDVVALRTSLLEKTDQLLIKTAPMLDVWEAIRQLQSVTKVWVVAVDNECKELLFLLEKQGIPMDQVPIVAVADPSAATHFSFTKKEEQESEVNYGPPEDYLIEPDVSILKAGAFKCFATHFGLFKLHPDSHLYTSKQLIKGVPGRTFRIKAVVKYEAKQVQNLIPGGKANVATRNFPDSPEQIKKKLRLKDGGTTYLFGTTLLEESKRILVCEKA